VSPRSRSSVGVGFKVVSDVGFKVVSLNAKGVGLKVVTGASEGTFVGL